MFRYKQNGVAENNHNKMKGRITEVEQETVQPSEKVIFQFYVLNLLYVILSIQ